MEFMAERQWLIVVLLAFGLSGCGGGGGGGGGGSAVKAPIITPPVGTLHTTAATLAIHVDVVDPNGLPMTVTWTRVSGPIGVMFTSAGNGDATVTFAANGSYQLRMSVSNGTISSTVHVTVDVADPAPFTLSTEVLDSGSAAVGVPVQLHWSPIGIIASEVTDNSGRIAFSGLIGRKDRFQMGVGP